ncbi:transmembrane protein 268 [Sceloporus undulatus]|uniref:transmembrane protein 268 n=1 Tax=Sceloporus undulatus TaxID=8520 RepID=UPI001C4AB308|nr:transmembrane protein 268 [Sceloporus undulatus]
MASAKSRTDAAEELSFSVSFAQSQAEDSSGSWKKRLRNGQVLLVLTAHQACSSNRFDINLWSDKLKNVGIEMTIDQWKHLVQRAVLEPEVRSYLFYNSRAFAIAIAVILYVTLWVNLYFTLKAFSVGPSWGTSIMATVIALVVAVAVRLIIHRCQRKMNMNTDMRLAAANEIFMEQEFLVGFTDLQDKHRNIPQLWFVHYKMGPCLQSLAETVATMKRNQESTLKHNLDKLCLVMETPVIPILENKPERSLEETPLLSEGRNSTREVLTFREPLRLIPDGAPEEMAQHLLAIFGSYYVRLLVSGQLPCVPSGWHVELAHAPCLCQFIETTVLGRKS